MRVIEITERGKRAVVTLRQSLCKGWGMASTSSMIAIGKLAMAGEQAGFKIEQMIDMLNSGLPVDALLQLIAQGLEESPSALPCVGSFRTKLSANRSTEA